MSKLDEALKAVNKTYKTNVINIGVTEKNFERIKFSSPQLNWLSRGGIPRGKIIEFSGREGSGKTTTALDVCKNAQILFQLEFDERLAYLEGLDKLSKTQQEELIVLNDTGKQRVLYVDVEHTLDKNWAELLGVCMDDLVYFDPDEDMCAEDIFQVILDLLDSKGIGLIVLDSIAVMFSKAEFAKDMDESTYGGISKPLTLFSKKLLPKLAKQACTMIGINQLRDNLKSSYGGTTTPGGRGWKHNCAVRMEFQKGSFINDSRKEIAKVASSNPFGNMVEVTFEKNKVSRPDRRLCSYTLTYSQGIDIINDYITIGAIVGVFEVSGAWYYLKDPFSGNPIIDGSVEDPVEEEVLKFHGIPALRTYLEENQDTEFIQRVFRLIDSIAIR